MTDLDHDDTESEIFAAASEPAPEPSAPVAAPAAADADVNEPAATAQPEPDANPDQGDLRVALRQERDERKRMQEEMAQLRQQLAGNRPAQPKAEEKAKPVFFEDPDGWMKAGLDPVAQHFAEQVQSTREFYSRRMADQAHGEEAVSAAYGALKSAIADGALDGPQIVAALNQSMDPFGDIMAWHKRHLALTEIGEDPAAYRERIRAEVQAELAGGQQPAAPSPQASAPAAPRIPSVNRAVGNAGAPHSTSITEDDIFNAAPAFGRRKE